MRARLDVGGGSRFAPRGACRRAAAGATCAVWASIGGLHMRPARGSGPVLGPHGGRGAGREIFLDFESVPVTQSPRIHADIVNGREERVAHADWTSSDSRTVDCASRSKTSRRQRAGGGFVPRKLPRPALHACMKRVKREPATGHTCARMACASFVISTANCNCQIGAKRTVTRHGFYR